MEKLLFVSYDHNNLNLASTIQNRRLIEALKKYYDVSIVCRSTSDDINLHAICTPNLYLFDRITYRIFPFLKSVFSIDRLYWSIHALKRIKPRLNEYDYVIFPFEPYTTRFLFYKLKKYSTVKIISLIYDPYYDNIFFSSSLIGKCLRRNIEKRIVRVSDLTIVNNSKLKNVFCNRYPDAHVELVPLCGKTEVNSASSSSHSKLNIVFAGNIFGKRKIDLLNESVSLAKNNIKELSKKIEFLIYGKVFVGQDVVISSGNDDVIVYKGCVEPDKVDVILSDADILLIIDPIDIGNHSYPSKLCEYFQYNKPIIGITGKDTPSYNALTETSNRVFTEHDAQKFADYIFRLVTCGVEPCNHAEYSKQFVPANVAKNISNIISKR